VAKLVSSNVVIVATNLNPSIFSQLWLVNNGILSAKDFEENRKAVFTPVAMSVSAQEFEFMVVPERLQISFSRKPEGDENLLTKTIGKIVELLPHTPYNAIGFNFGWLLKPTNPERFGQVTRELFLPQNSPLSAFFSEPDCRYGVYLSKNVRMGRLRLEIKPNILHSSDRTRQEEFLRLSFNFNLDLVGDNKVRDILNFLGNWKSAHGTSSEMAAAAGRGWSE